MEAKDIKWCPQHGYPLPCYKCGMPLSQPQQKEIYEAGKQAGIREVFNWQHAPCPHKNESYFARDCAKCLQAKLKEWGIE